MNNNDSNYLWEIFQGINDLFNLSEIQTIAFNLSLDWDELFGNVKSEKTRSLVISLSKSGRIDELIKYLRIVRPHALWPQSPTKDQQIRDSSKFQTSRSELHPQISYNQRPWQDKQLPPVRFFVGRKKVINNVLNLLAPSQAITLWGAGGQGKTAVVWKVLTELRQQNELESRFPDGTIIYHFSPQTSVEGAYIHIARSLGEEVSSNPFAAFQRAITGRRALLIFENTEEIEPDKIGQLISSRGTCGVLLTTRRQTDAVDREQLFRVDKLPQLEAVQLLQNILNMPPGISEPFSQKLCALVDGHPLAIVVAGKYILESGESLEEYVFWLAEDIIGALGSDSLMDKMLTRTFEQLSKEAQQTFTLISCFANIPFEQRVLQYTFPWTITQFKRCRKLLIDFGLLNSLEDSQLQFSHSLIYQYARSLPHIDPELIIRLGTEYFNLLKQDAQEDGKNIQGLVNAQFHIIAILRRTAELKYWETFSKLFWDIGIGKENLIWKYGFRKSEVYALGLGISAARELNQDSYLQNLSYRLGKILAYQGLMNEAIVCYEQALSLAIKANQRKQEEIYQSEIGKLYVRIQNGSEALEKFRKAYLVAQELGHVENQIDYLEAMAHIYFRHNQPEIAINKLHQAIDILQKFDSGMKEHQRLYEFARKLRQFDIIDVERTLVRRALNLAKQLEDYSSVLQYYLALIDIIEQPEETLEEAIAFFEQALLSLEQSEKNKNLRAKHLYRIARLNQKKGHWKKAAELYEQSLLFSETPNKDLWAEYNLLGKLYEEIGDIGQAVKYYQLALGSIPNDMTHKLNRVILLVTLEELLEDTKDIELIRAAKNSNHQITPTKNEPPNTIANIGGQNPLEDPVVARKEVVILVNGKNVNNEKIYCYLKIILEIYPLIRTLLETGAEFNLLDYGEVVLAGTGEPSSRPIEAMKRLYDMIPIN